MDNKPRSRRRDLLPPRSLTRQITDKADTAPEIVQDFIGPDPSSLTIDRLIPSGVTLLNCACSDNPFGAFGLGSINTIPGQSASGKTELMLTVLASCAIDNRFDKYELILDDAEWSMSFDLNYLFPPLVHRMIAPEYDETTPIYSETVQDFERNILVRLQSEKPFIWVLDSLDSLTSTQELEREYKNAIKKAKTEEAIKELKQSYGTEKARIIGAVLRMINGKIRSGNNVLFIVQQTRANIIKNAGLYGIPSWTTAGGEAPFFYSFHRVYMNVTGPIKDTAKNIKEKIGGHITAEVIKNKLTGKRRSIHFDIYEDLGIDDVSSCVEFLKKTGTWKMEGSYMKAPGILGSGEKMYKADLIRYIEKESAIRELQVLVGKIWNEKEDALRLKDRARRF